MKEIDLVYLTAFRETLCGRLVVVLDQLAKREDHVRRDADLQDMLDEAASLRTRLSYVNESMRYVDAAPSES